MELLFNVDRIAMAAARFFVLNSNKANAPLAVSARRVNDNVAAISLSNASSRGAQTL